MNSYTAILSTADDEIRKFALSESGAQSDTRWYDRICELVEQVRVQQSNSEAERILDVVMRMIVDSCPLGSGFAPAIGAAADAMQRRRKRSASRQ